MDMHKAHWAEVSKDRHLGFMGIMVKDHKDQGMDPHSKGTKGLTFLTLSINNKTWCKITNCKEV